MARIAGKQNGKRKAEPASPVKTFPKLRLVEKEHTIKTSKKMEFVSKKENGIVTTTAEPVRYQFSLAGFHWTVKQRMNSRGGVSIDVSIDQKSVLEACSYDAANSGCGHWFDRDFWGLLLEDPEENEEVRTEVNVELEFTVTQIVGFRCRKSFSFDFNEPSQESNLVFKFGDDSVYMDCNFLSYHSEYFSATQNRLETMKKDENGISLEEIVDVEKNAFVELLQIVYPARKEVTDDNVELIMVLADRFMFEGVLKDCEKFLMSQASKTDIFLKLHWSSLYHMIDLQEWCFAQLKTRGAIDKVKKSDVYSKLSSDVKSSLLERMLDI